MSDAIIVVGGETIEVTVGGDLGLPIPSTAGNAGKFMVAGIGGDLQWASGTGTDAGLRTDLASPDLGTNLSAFTIGKSAADKLNEIRSLDDARQSSDDDENNAFASLIDDGYRRIMLPGAKGFGDNGDYSLWRAAPVDGLSLIGDGAGRTVIRAPDNGEGSSPVPGSRRGIIEAIASSIDSPIRNLHFQGITFADDPDNAFAEGRHLILGVGVEDVLIENCKFYGFRGDGISFEGESQTASLPEYFRHNKRIRVANCVFDGVDKENRNGISVIDVDGLVVEGCYFTQIARLADMPGAIDLEPNAYADYILRNVTVRDCLFDNIGGNLGVITLFVPDQVTGDVGRFAFINNRVRNCYRDFYIRKGATTPSASTPAVDIVIDQHQGSGGTLPFAFVTARGINVTPSCSFRDYTGSAWIGYTDSPDNAYWRVRDVNIAAEFERCASGGGNAINFYKGDYVNFDGARFLACGNGGTNDGSIGFLSGSSTNVTLKNCVARDVGGKTIKAVYVAGGHTLQASTNRQRDNQWSGLTNEFVANRSDVPQSFLPSITGFTNGASVTISDNGSYYWVDGVQMFIDSVVQWTSNGGATGASVFRLPDLGAFTVYTPGGSRDTSLAVIASGAGSALSANERLVGRFTNGFGFPALILQRLNTTTGVYSDFVAASSATTLSVSGSMLLAQG